MKCKISKQNLRMAKFTLDTDLSLAEIGRRFGGKSRACVWQNLRRFCKHFLFEHERLTPDGKLRKLSELRKVWKDSFSGKNIQF